MAARRSFRRTANSRGAILGTASARRTQTQHGKPSTRCITGFADNAQQFWRCHWLCRRSSHQGGLSLHLIRTKCSSPWTSNSIRTRWPRELLEPSNARMRNSEGTIRRCGLSSRKRNRGRARLFRDLEARPSPKGHRAVPARFRTLRMNWMRRLLPTPPAKLMRSDETAAVRVGWTVFVTLFALWQHAARRTSAQSKVRRTAS